MRERTDTGYCRCPTCGAGNPNPTYHMNDGSGPYCDRCLPKPRLITTCDNCTTVATLEDQVEQYRAALEEIADTLEEDGRFPNTVPSIREVLSAPAPTTDVARPEHPDARIWKTAIAWCQKANGMDDDCGDVYPDDRRHRCPEYRLCPLQKSLAALADKEAPDAES